MKHIVVYMSNMLINQEVLDQKDKVRFEYGLTLLLEVLLDIIGFILLGYILNIQLQLTIFLLTFAIVRVNAGGYHAKTFISCFIGITSLALISIYLLPIIKIPSIYWILLCISNLIVYVYAPVESITKPLSAKRKVICRNRSLITVLILDIFILTSLLTNNNKDIYNLLVLSLTAQSLTMLPIINKRKEEKVYEKI